ncbi:MAG: ATP-binding protein [Candidatus Nanopelagicales bacterium]|nr:ATP-binding protein [Candidatus Nanopelagicales bacterium]
MPILQLVTWWLAVLILGVGTAVGLVVGVVIGWRIETSRRIQPSDRPTTSADPPEDPPVGESINDGRPVVQGSEPDLLDRILAALPEPALLVEAGTGQVVRVSRPAIGLGLVAGNRLAPPELVQLVRELGVTAGVSEREITLRRSSRSRSSVELLVRAVQIPPDHLLLMIQDLSTTRRLDQVRRDFVANVSHELKTPVGAMSLLAEAVATAADDPGHVRDFAARIQHETARLTHLVNDLIDLNRIQGEDPLRDADLVAVDEVVREAIVSIRLGAQAKGIVVMVGGTQGLAVLGIGAQIVTAVRNLLVNAVAYSPPQTRVAVATRLRGDYVEISVTDQGIGIPEVEQDRIFERFYRVDQARSRATGGTGLGLAIVKHVCQNHGGAVSVWSQEGEGSTFTLRLPAAPTIDGGAEARDDRGSTSEVENGSGLLSKHAADGAGTSQGRE